MCFAVIVGKLASKDGSVLFGHNEQNVDLRRINYRRVLRSGEDYSYLWVESPGLEFSDNYFNEWGVAIAGNGCPTKEDSLDEVVLRGDILEGGIGYMLPRLVATKSRTAREGLHTAAALLDRYGYTGSGRSLIIADSDEAFVLAIARGRHYMAQRVPDDAVVLVPNTHVVALGDAIKSKNIAEYASSRGWFDAKSLEPLSFTRAFAAPQASGMEREKGICSRQWHAQAMASGKRASLECELPFAVYPHKPFTVSDVAEILRSHLEGAEHSLPMTKAPGSPHEPEDQIDESFARSICNIATQESVIWQLRGGLPTELGCLAWRATGVPCVSVYTPWYLAVEDIPTVFHDGAPIDEALDLARHFTPLQEFSPSTENAFEAYYQLARFVEQDYHKYAPRVKAHWHIWEREQFSSQEHIEKAATELWHINQSQAKKLLSSYSIGRALSAWQQAIELLRELRGGQA